MKRPHWNKPAWKKPTWAGLKASLTTRAFRVGGYSVAAAAIVVFLAVVANILVNALPASVTQLDTTAGTLYTLSQETEDILDGLEQDVTIYWIVQSGQEDETLGTLLDRYAARSDYVTLETIDPDVSPNFLQEYVSGTVYNNSLIVESGDRNTYVSYEDIYEYSYSSDYSSYDVSFAGESSLTSAIDYVLSDTLPKLYTLTGHGEDDLSTSFQSAVEQQNIEVADLSLLTEESVPEDADCLLINGPDSDLSQDEVEAIQAYLDTGGDLIVLTDPAQDGQDLTNLEALMGEYGMTANDGVVIEGDTANYALGSPFYLLPNLESHSITSPLQEGGYYIRWPWPRGSRWRRAPGRPHRRVPADHFRCRLLQDRRIFHGNLFSRRKGTSMGPFLWPPSPPIPWKTAAKAMSSGSATPLCWTTSITNRSPAPTRTSSSTAWAGPAKGRKGSPSTPNRSPPSTLP